MSSKTEAIAAAKEICQKQYSDAKSVFLAGSVVRGEATAFSDLDIVVVYEKLDHAWRESFVYKNWPVEVFAHDLETLKYFFYEVDAKSGMPSLPQMVSEGVLLTIDCEFAQSLKTLANSLLQQGPQPLTERELLMKRYAITDLIDDMQEPRNQAELTATGIRLFEELANFYFRANNLWSASGKMIIRKLKQADPLLAKQFQNAFEKLFVTAKQKECIELAESILKPFGGFLFDGYKLDAPADWRSK
jgi:hypothetical protein